MKSLVVDISEHNDVDIIGFADSHGGLNLIGAGEKYDDLFEYLREIGQDWGMHLHDHTGRAIANYWALQKGGCKFMDVSSRGLGKGAGNLPMEHVLRNEDVPKLIDYYLGNENGPLSISKRDGFCIISGRLKITDNYALLGRDLNLSAIKFYKVAKRLSGRDKDSFNADKFKNILKNILKTIKD